jgi:hypothetical protein
MIQCFNNKFIKSFNFLDFLNVFLSLLNFIDLIAEISLLQLVSNGEEYFLLNKSDLGFELEQTKKKKTIETERKEIITSKKPIDDPTPRG